MEATRLTVGNSFQHCGLSCDRVTSRRRLHLGAWLGGWSIVPEQPVLAETAFCFNSLQWQGFLSNRCKLILSSSSTNSCDMDYD